ncbi:MAG TPA: hypothetical protein DET40_06020 [Lentisphaeria bacterium]|nr:MAG: hypothetical protein A2X45_04525 [Lentisphaerae bacterium GWF2_50_93]HCE43084.1 hypothetical protein [Lentisphaeria bacterium]
MNKNITIYMASAIIMLVFACAILTYSSMSNKSRALSAESELDKLRKTLDSHLKDESAKTPEKKKSSSPSMVNMTAPQTPPPSSTEARDVSTPPLDRFRTSMEKIKETDPERYAAMVERMNNFNKQMQENSNKQGEFLKKLDTKSMTPEQLDNHNKLLPLVAKNNQLLYEINQNPEGEKAPALRRELFDNSRQMRDLMETERSAALQQFATQLGYTSDQTGQFEEYIKLVYEMTSSNPGAGAGRRNNRGDQQGQPNRQ